jgi:hypothetical protein
MSMDFSPILLANDVTMSMPCGNSLTDQQVRSAQAALRSLDPEWSLECCENCEADLFLDLTSLRPDGRRVSFILHARGDVIDVLRMIDDDDSPLGSFDDMALAVRGIIEAIEAGSAETM